MKWAWRIGRFSGIDVYVHATFLILVPFVWLQTAGRGGSTFDFLYSLTFLLTIFGIVVLHEFGHALAARHYGIRTRDITLLPIGGVARLERMPEDPRQELVVALAGPAVNVVIVILLTLFLTPAALVASVRNTYIPGEGFLTSLLWANVWLVIFNLIPAFPMDGGRVLRASLAWLTHDYNQATQIAARIGQGVAVLFALAGLFVPGFKMLLFIAIFVWFGAAGEAQMVQAKATLRGLTVQQAMLPHFQTLARHEPLSAAVSHILAGFQHDLPVLEQGRLVGLLPRAELLAALKRHPHDAPVGEVMRQDYVAAHPLDTLDGVIARLQPGQCASIPVVVEGRVVGLVTAETVAQYSSARRSMNA